MDAPGNRGQRYSHLFRKVCISHVSTWLGHEGEAGEGEEGRRGIECTCDGVKQAQRIS